MKRCLLFTCTIIFALVLVFDIVYAESEIYKFEDWTYRIIDNESAEIIKYSGNKSYLNIPDMIGNYTVISIGNEAFKGNTEIRSVKFQKSIISIGDSAFEGCTKLQSVSNLYRTSIDHIGKCAFKDCTSLSSIDIPKKLSEIQASVFEGCTSLRQVDYPFRSSVKSIGEKAFFNCSSLKSIEIPVTVTIISDSAFEGCVFLKEINNLSNSNVAVIGKCAFRGCTRISIFEAPFQLLEIGESAFEGCKRLAKISYLDEEKVTIGVNAFANCPRLENSPKKAVIDESKLLSDDSFDSITFPEFIDSAKLCDDASVLGSWHSIGQIMRNVVYDLPNYETFYNLTIYSDGTASVSRNNKRIENGLWERYGAKLIIDFDDSGEYIFWITEKYLLMQFGKTGFVFINDNTSDPAVPKFLEANDDRQFNGEWKISRVVSPDCDLSTAQLFYMEIDDCFAINITDDTAEVVLSADQTSSIVYKKTLINGNLNLSNDRLRTSVQLSLADTSEMVITLYESGSIVYVCLKNTSEAADQVYDASEPFADQIYYIKDENVTITIPSKLVCVTRNADSSDSFYHRGYGDYESLQSIMLNNNMFLYGTTEDHKDELILQILEFNDYDFNSANDYLLTSYMDQIKQSLSWQGAEKINSDIYEGGHFKAIRYRFVLKPLLADQQYIVMYYATHGEKEFIIRFVSLDDEISENEDRMIQDIFDSVVWGEIAAENKVFTDFSKGVSYTIPSGWSAAKTLDDESEVPDKLRIGSGSVWVSYDREDLWQEYYKKYGETADLLGLTRSNFLLLENLRNIVARKLNCDEYMIDHKKISGIDYYFMNAWGRDSQENVQYFCFVNGYMYNFVLGGKNTNNQVDQFERFLMTVEYIGE